jgi:hypothetical protein
MKSLEKIIKVELLKIPEFTLDYFQSEIFRNLYLEFFFEKCRFLISPDFHYITTGQGSEIEKKKLENILTNHRDAILKTKSYIMYNLSFYSSLLETNSFYITQNNYLVIARIIFKSNTDNFEVKLYTINESDLPDNYLEKLYLGRDFISLKSIKRDYLGISWMKNSLAEQLIKLHKRLTENLSKEDFAKIKNEFLGELENLGIDFSDSVEKLTKNLPREISSSNVENETLIQSNVGFRSLKHILVEMDEAVCELERYMFEKNFIPAVRFATKLKKDITNAVNYIMFKVNGRISDYVNNIHI